MKNLRYFVIASAICLVLIVAIAGKYNAEARTENSNKDTKYLTNVLELLKRRTKIMNKAIFENNDLDIIKKELGNIEKGECFNNDITVLKEIKNNPTDFSYVNGLKIKELIYAIMKQDSIEFTMKIEWDITDCIGREKVEGIYRIEMICKGENFYLVKFDWTE